MNTGSAKLNEILGSQLHSSSKAGLGYVQCASSSKDKGKIVFVQGPTMNAPPIVYSNTAYPKNFSKPKFILICHFCGIKRHIRPHCNKLRNFNRNQRRRQKSTTQQIMTKPVWVRKSDLRCNVVLTALSATNSCVVLR